MAYNLRLTEVRNQIIKCLNQIISENKPYNLRLRTFTLHKFQQKNLNLNGIRTRTSRSLVWGSAIELSWNNQDSSMAERQTRDLEV